MGSMTCQMPLTKYGTRFDKRVEIQSPLKEHRLCQSLRCPRHDPSAVLSASRVRPPHHPLNLPTPPSAGRLSPTDIYTSCARNALNAVKAMPRTTYKMLLC